MEFTVIVLFVSAELLSKCYATNQLEEKFAWKMIDFNFSSKETRDRAIKFGEFVPQNNIPFGIEVWRDKLFVTVPRRQPGVPSTLNFVPLNSKNASPLLNPYPDWKSNNISSAFLVSIYRVNVDTCNRLWTIDTGSVMDFQGRGSRVQSPRIKIFDLEKDQLVREYALREQQDYVCDTSYINIVSDVTDSCDEAFAYAVDPGSNSMLVYSLRANDSWRIQHALFLPHVFHTEYTIGNASFQWNDGIFGMALAERGKSGYRNVFLHPMASLFELISSTKILQNKSLSAYPNNKHAFKILGSRNPTFQAASSAFDEKSGVLFFSLVSKNAIGCWNSRKFPAYLAETNDVVAGDNTTMVYSSDLKVDKMSNLWAISNRLPVILSGSFNQEDVNFRIFNSPVPKVIKNTICEQQRNFWSKRH